MPKGEKLDILTGLGNGYNTEKSGNAPLLVGGGVGVPPLYKLAKNLISSSNIPIETIALKLGFGSYINLYKAFIKSEKCSPNQYREKKTESIT
jgi:NAD(P)H-flavin reductase